MPDPHTLLLCVLIILARICDVSLGTLRTISVVHGRAALAWVLGFCEVLIWLFAVSRVLMHLDTPLLALAYAPGYATGNYLGVRIEDHLPLGEQVVRIFTRCGPQLAARLREAGFRVTQFEGCGRDGLVHLLLIEIPRRQTARLLEIASRADPLCFYIIDDIRLAANAAVLRQRSTGWRGIFKKK